MNARIGAVALLVLSLWANAFASDKRGFAATVNPMATDAALAAMRDGGNAVDGAIAAALTLAVVDSHNSGIGGGLFMLIRTPDGEFTAIDGREMAPAGGKPELYLREGKPQPERIQHGPLAAAVPGEIAALFEAAKRHGKLPMSYHLRAASKLARDGFMPDATLRARIDSYADRMRAYPEAAAIFLKGGGALQQGDLSLSLYSMANHGPDWFYRGPFATILEHWMQTNGGVMTARDLANYKVELRTPVKTTYRDYEIVGFPPPSSGGVHVAEILNILETFNLKKMGDGSAEFYHVIAEAMKLAFADRAHWLGDPAFAPVPRGLLDKEYAHQLAKRIDRARATPVVQHGEPPRWRDDLLERHTTHFSVADAAGYWVACTATINNTFGSLVVIPGTGVLLNNEMDDLSLPGMPNSFGLVGSDANAIAPGKRPLSSMSPTLVLKKGKPVMSLGAAGGPTIISQVVLAIVRAVDFGLSPEQALARPRVHQQWRPDKLRIENTVPEKVQEELRRRGHDLEVVKAIGVSQAVSVSGKTFSGAHDPRVPGKAAGF